MITFSDISPNVGYQYRSLFEPVRIENVSVQYEGYVDGVDSRFVPAIEFSMLSIHIDELRKYENTSESDWAASGYKKPLKESFKNVEDFLVALPINLQYYLQPGDIEPTSYGTIVLDFIKENNKVSLEIGKSKIGYYTQFENKDNSVSEGIEYNSNGVPKEIMGLLNKLVA